MKAPAWLATLAETGTVGLSAANRGVVDELVRLGIVAVKAAGTRRRVAVSDPSQLAQWIRARYPTHAIDPDRAPTRMANIVRSGGSKAGRRSHEVLPLLFKWFGDAGDPLSRICRAHGMAAVLTDRVSDLALPPSWRLLTVENWEPFLSADYGGAPAAVMVAYLGGNVSDTVLQALNAFRHPPDTLLHFGDYDWEGLYIFQRLQKAVAAARLYVPDDIEARFAEFGSRRLIARQTRRAAFDMHNRDCRPVIRLIARYNAGLEQEIVGLPPPAALASPA